jgi:hypothetical protein
MELDKFEEFLSQGNMAKNTISAYLYAVKEFGSRHKELNKRNLLVYKTYLIETYKPKTVRAPPAPNSSTYTTIPA